MVTTVILAVFLVCCGAMRGDRGSIPTVPSPVPTPAPDPLTVSAQVSVYSTPSFYSGSYTEGMWIRLIAEFEDPVQVDGSPRLAIHIGDHVRYAEHAPYAFGHRYSNPDHANKRAYMPRFDYLIQADDYDQDGISIDSFDFEEGALMTSSGQEIEVEIEPSDLGFHPVMGRPSPRSCTNELERARGRHPILVEEWEGTPFQFYFSLTGTPPEMRGEAYRVLEAARRLSDRIEEQIGYPIFEVAGLLDTPTGYPFNDEDCYWRKRGQIVAMYDSKAQANYQCATWAGTLDIPNGTVAHNTFHIFGYDHHPNDWRGPGIYEKGVFMSRRLTGVYVDRESVGVAFEDVDALRCIFPQSDRIH